MLPGPHGESCIYSHDILPVPPPTNPSFQAGWDLGSHRNPHRHWCFARPGLRRHLSRRKKRRKRRRNLHRCKLREIPSKHFGLWVHQSYVYQSVIECQETVPAGTGGHPRGHLHPDTVTSDLESDVAVPWFGGKW